MKVSIITTCYNRVRTVPLSVLSVKEQSYAEIEHIIVDGASTDGSVEAIRAVGSPRIKKLISEKDRGCYEALNKGIRQATGDIVGWLHSDDVYYSQEVIAHVVRAFRETDCDLLYGNGLFVSPENPNWVLRDWISGKCSDSRLENGWLPLHTTVFIRRSVLNRFPPYREDYHISSDTDWLLTVMYKTGIKIYYLNKYLVVMNYGGLSTDWGKTILRWREDLGIYIQHGISPRTALIKKVLRKVPQFLKAPFKRFAKLKDIAARALEEEED